VAPVHDVLRYLLARVPAGTQDEHDQVAALIDQDETGRAAAAKKES
jgi:hypothetical protein